MHPLSDEYASHWLTLRCVTAAHEAELCAAMFHDNFALHLAIQLLCFCLLVPLIQAGGRAWVGHAVVFACAPFTLLMMAARVWLHRLADRHLAQRLGTKTLFRVSYAALAASRVPDLLAYLLDTDVAALLMPPPAAAAAAEPLRLDPRPRRRRCCGSAPSRRRRSCGHRRTSPSFVVALMLGAYMVLLATFSPGWSLGRVGIIAANIGSILSAVGSAAAPTARSPRWRTGCC